MAAYGSATIDDNKKVFDEFKTMIAEAKLSPNMGKAVKRCATAP